LKIQVASIEDITFDSIKRIIAANKFFPYTEYGIPIELLTKYFLQNLNNSINKDFFVILATKSDNIIGLLAGGKSDWDSKHFGVDIAKVEYILTLGDYCERKQISKQLLSCFSTISKHKLAITRTHTEDTAIIHSLEENSFKLMDTLVTYFFDFRNPITSFKEICKIEPMKEKEMAELRKISMTSFSEPRIATDHFHADSRLDKAKSDSLYEKWVEDIGKSEFSKVLVAKIRNCPVGFSAGKINYQLNDHANKKIASIILSAVSPEYRQAHIYTSIIQAFLRFFLDKVDIVDIGTHVANYPVQRAWSRLGFKIVRSQHTWHKWID
jgi:ribosomal protein S18 acetylase RimI-like enzyme